MIVLPVNQYFPERVRGGLPPTEKRVILLYVFGWDPLASQG